MTNVTVVLKIGPGTFQQGFPVTLRVLREGRLLYEEASDVPLPPVPDLPELYANWLTHYTKLGGRAIQSVSAQITNYSAIGDCQSAFKELSNCLRNWFAQSAFRFLRNQILAESGVSAYSSPPIAIEVDRGLDKSDAALLYKLPWTLWTDLFDRLPNADAVLGIGNRPTAVAPPLTHNIKILAVFGSQGGLDLDPDRQALKELKRRGSEITFLEQPDRDVLHEQLGQGSHSLIFFSGHSTSETWEEGYEGGYLQISDRSQLSLNDLRKDLEQAIANGLQCIILNSCDGLGIASYLIDLQVPYVVVMKELVSDRAAREFLKEFLHEFSTSEIPLHLAVRRARDRLHWLESDQHPCPAASWLPIVVCHPTQDALTWSTLKPQLTLTNISHLRFLMTKIPPIVYISLLALGVGGYWGLEQFWASNTPLSSSDLPPSKLTFADVEVPTPTEGAFKFAGSTASAAFLCEGGENAGSGGIHAQIRLTHPGFQLKYISPATGAPHSGKGIELLMNNQVDFVLSSRLPKLEEEKQARQQNFELQSIPIAQYANSYSVHPEVGVGAIGGLTFDNLAAIFTSDIPLDWQQFGGAPQRITPYVHEAEKGALYGSERRFGRFGLTVKYVETTTLAMQAIASDYGGIYRSPSVLTFGQQTVATMPIINNQGEAVLPFTDPNFNPTEACRNLNRDANAPAPINPDYPSELQEPLYVILKDYPGSSNVQERAGRAYAELLRSAQGREMLSAIGFQPINHQK